MKRRNFLRNSFAAGAGAITIGNTLAGGMPVSNAPFAEKPFVLNFAPHDGMFGSHAGKDFVEQIKFMHAQGFRSIEDNGMLKRSKEEQNSIGATLSKLGMTLGVFVVDGGENWKVSLTTGKQEFKDVFIKRVRIALNLQTRKQMVTVVPDFSTAVFPWAYKLRMSSTPSGVARRFSSHTDW